MTKTLISNGTTSRLLSVVTNGLADNTKAAYQAAILDYQQWSIATGHGFSREGVMAYVEHMKTLDLSHATVNQRLSALRRMANEVLYYPTTTQDQRTIAEGVIAIKNLPQRGRRLPYWLNDDEAKELLAAPNRKTLRGKRDYLILGLLMGAALRREEAANLTWDHIQQRDDQWLIVNLVGKGNRTRSIPLAGWVVNALTEWGACVTPFNGLVLRAVNRGDRLTGRVETRGGRTTNGGMTTQAVYAVIKRLGRKIGIGELEPHDLRRTWAGKARRQGCDLGQISMILGHSNLATTQRYLGEDDLDLDSPVHVSYE